MRLFPHQLHVAERATITDPVRWLLADEVGLGKTIEACLILNRLVHTRRVERCLVVAPASLTVQWLGELWRKYHQVFTLLDERRLADVARDFGAGFNPFDLHRRAVIALETLTADPQLTAQAVAAGIDLLVVDEAQRLRRPPGHPGEPPWRAVAPIAALGRHVLLLSATPLEDDAHGFFRLLQLLRPEEFPEDVGFEARLASATPLPPCTSSTRRVDIGGLPPRVGTPIVIDDPARWRLREAVEDTLRRPAAANPVARQKKGDRIRRALASGAALAAVLGPDEPALREQAQAMDASDPRLDWLLAQAPRWRDAREKTLVFVAHRETLEMLRTALSHRGQLATGAFHEELPPSRRDLGSGPVPRGRRPQPAGLHRGRRRGPQLRVLPPAGAVRPAVEAVGGRAAHRTPRPHRPAASRWRSSTSARPAASAPTRPASSRRSVCFASRWPAWSRSSPRWRARSMPWPTTPAPRCRTTRARRSSPTWARRVRESAKPRFNSSTAIPTAPPWRQASWRASPPISTR